jgi:hypothetical protein
MQSEKLVGSRHDSAGLLRKLRLAQSRNDDKGSESGSMISVIGPTTRGHNDIEMLRAH